MARSASLEKPQLATSRPLNSPKGMQRKRRFSDLIFKVATGTMAWLVVVLIVWIAVRLYLDSALSRHHFGLHFLTISVWDEVHRVYGALPFIYGTVVTSIVALLIAAPVGIGSAIFLSELCPRKLGSVLSFFIELLAAVPSIIYGLWGLFVLCPFLSEHIYGPLQASLGWTPFFSGSAIPTNLFAAGLILALMVLPYITSISYQVFQTLPKQQRSAALGLGTTRWEVIRHVILPEATGGITGAVILAFGRAIGETMAVALVVGSSVQIKASLLQPGYTMPALLANQFAEAFNQPFQLSALLEIAFILFLITFLINAIARLMLLRYRNQITSKNGSRKKEVNKERMSQLRRISGQLVGLLVLISIFKAGLYAHTLLGHLLGIGVPLVVSITVLLPHFLKAEKQRSKFRRAIGKGWSVILAMMTLVGVVGLGSLFFYVAIKGAKDFNVDLFTKLPGDPTLNNTGIKNAIIGTIYTVGIGSVLGIPIGLLGGVYLAEFSRGTVGTFIKFCSDVLNGIPSVVIGLFAYGAFVLPFGHFSSWAGGAALGVMIIPTVLRTTEDMLLLIPADLRTASLGLGSTKVQTILFVVIPAASRGIITGVMLAVARIAGETAPLLFTAYGFDQMQTNPNGPISTITMVIYKYAESPWDSWNQQAWSCALVLLLLILVLSLGSRLITARQFSNAT